MTATIHPASVIKPLFMPSLEQIGQIKNHQLFWLHGCLTRQLRSQLTQFWLVNRALDNSAEAWRRTFDVACLATDRNDHITGVSSIYVDRLRGDGPTYWFYRAFIRPDSRAFGLAILLLQQTCEGLQRRYADEAGAPVGIVIVTENPKLQLPGCSRWFHKHGFELLAKNERGQNVWRKPFPVILP